MIAIFGCTCKANIQISQAKSEALDDIYSLLKQNIKWCNAKRRRQRRRTAKNKQTNKQTKGLISQKTTTLHVKHTVFGHFFAVALYGYNVKLAETSTCSRSLFFTAAHCFGGPSISHFVTAATKFSCCSSNKKCLFCFLSLALDLCRPFSR